LQLGNANVSWPQARRSTSAALNASPKRVPRVITLSVMLTWLPERVPTPMVQAWLPSGSNVNQ
jgi:hypothetical protein